MSDINYPEKIQFKQIEDLLYDSKNPRLPSSIVKGDNEKEVINWMLTDGAILELMGSIGEKGFFPAEPLLVVESKNNRGKFDVVEGNRRLTAVKLLNNPLLADVRRASIKSIVEEAKNFPKKLPVFIFEKRQDILDYLGFKHITGVKSWSALAKAKYLRELQHEYSELEIEDQYKSLAKAIGSRSDYVRDLLVGLDLYDQIAQNDYFDISNLNEKTIEFGVYYTALSRANIPRFLGIDRNSNKPMENINLPHVREFTEWVSKTNDQNVTRLGESRNLTKLSQILVNEKALAAFRQGKSLDESLMYTEEPEVVFQSSVVDSLSKLNVANNYFHRVTIFYESDRANIKEINTISSNLMLLVSLRLADTLK